MQGGFENNHVEFCAKDFLLKPPVQFYRGLDYIALAARCAFLLLSPGSDRQSAVSGGSKQPHMLACIQELNELLHCPWKRSNGKCALSSLF